MKAKSTLRILRESTFQPFREDAGRAPQYPPDHKPVMKVTPPGSTCANCEYLGPDQKTCKSKYYIAFMGTNKLPYPANKMCSDWWEPK